MKLYWIFFFFSVVAYTHGGDEINYDDYNWYTDDLDELTKLSEEIFSSGEDVKEIGSKEVIDNDGIELVSSEEIEKVEPYKTYNQDEEERKFEEKIEDLNTMDLEYNEKNDDINDYQFEDNRSEVKYDKESDEQDVENNPMRYDSGSAQIELVNKVVPLDDDEKMKPNNIDEQSSKELDDIIDTNIELADEEILQETNKILNEDSDDGDFPALNSSNEEVGKFDFSAEVKKLFEETDKILNEDSDDGDFPVANSSNEEIGNVNVDLSAENENLEDTNQEISNEDSNDDDFPEVNSSNDEGENENFELSAEDKKILEATKEILNEDGDDSDFSIKSSNKEVENNDFDIMEETKKILEDDLSDENIGDFNDESINENISEEEAENDEVDDDTVDKAYSDLLKELDRLRDTVRKLSDDDDNNDTEPIGYEQSNKNEHLEHENDYEEISDDDLAKLFEDLPESEDSEEVNQSEEGEKGEEESRISFIDDALFANERIETTTNSVGITEGVKDVTKESEENVRISDATTNSVEVTPQVAPLMQSADITDLDYDALMKKFAVEHSEDLKISASDMTRSSVHHVTLNHETPVFVTSPGFPNPYPTNAVTDWMLEGPGRGIELIIHEFNVNGFMGDYMLIKPGGDDESGTDGLIFSYSLNTERKYRFISVNKMFVRFEARLGMQFARGFNMTVKFIAPLIGASDPNAQPDPERPLPGPSETITMNLAGLTLEQFVQIEEEFRLIVADMATMYIHANGIDPGLNTTAEVTQITSMGLCFHNWPKFENCAEVQFGVPLVYEDDAEPRLNKEDLRKMWLEYSQQDPFAHRLRRLGITEFQVPNDTGVLMVWLAIGLGVMVSMMMLAFALWRFSCFEDYTRMPVFSDTDSLNEKRTLDLYPTPHQTLPPLYSETDYKWADGLDDPTRVDIGGYANKSYMRSEVYDIDSDEEVIAGRDRHNSISPRDLYSVV